MNLKERTQINKIDEEELEVVTDFGQQHQC